VEEPRPDSATSVGAGAGVAGGAFYTVGGLIDSSATNAVQQYVETDCATHTFTVTPTPTATQILTTTPMQTPTRTSTRCQRIPLRIQCESRPKRQWRHQLARRRRRDGYPNEDNANPDHTANAGANPDADSDAHGCPNADADEEMYGDCNGDGTVTINELIMGVNIALGSAPLGDCSAYDKSGTAW